MPLLRGLVDGATDGEVELAATGVGGAIHVVEAVAPVEAEKTEHGQIDALR